MEWSAELTLEFLELYEREACIWNPRDPLHKNRIAVSDAWKRIEYSLSVEVSVPELKKKKESLMATFRPIMQKVIASQKSGGGPDDVYKSNWFAFDAMFKFLQGIYQPKSGLNAEG
ncbi:uncharacterized protein LOC108907647 [Anoplophora glabripennis]|uniref:uncharacterized protein LOC108907647 n=1 Tax=Anoplophora glabripennis TaxID=217634 RepID=UPI00087367C1|nr:uncharacterized protein LOC108907647 [Anoplophora glabripennis]